MSTMYISPASQAKSGAPLKQAAAAAGRYGETDDENDDHGFLIRKSPPSRRPERFNLKANKYQSKGDLKPVISRREPAFAIPRISTDEDKSEPFLEEVRHPAQTQLYPSLVDFNPELIHKLQEPFFPPDTVLCSQSNSSSVTTLSFDECEWITDMSENSAESAMDQTSHQETNEEYRKKCFFRQNNLIASPRAPPATPNKPYGIGKKFRTENGSDASVSMNGRDSSKNHENLNQCREVSSGLQDECESAFLVPTRNPSMTNMKGNTEFDLPKEYVVCNDYTSDRPETAREAPLMAPYVIIPNKITTGQKPSPIPYVSPPSSIQEATETFHRLCDNTDHDNECDDHYKSACHITTQQSTEDSSFLQFPAQGLQLGGLTEEQMIQLAVQASMKEYEEEKQLREIVAAYESDTVLNLNQEHHQTGNGEVISYSLEALMLQPAPTRAEKNKQERNKKAINPVVAAMQRLRPVGTRKSPMSSEE